MNLPRAGRAPILKSRPSLHPAQAVLCSVPPRSHIVRAESMATMEPSALLPGFQGCCSLAGSSVQAVTCTNATQKFKVNILGGNVKISCTL